MFLQNGKTTKRAVKNIYNSLFLLHLKNMKD